MKSTRVISVVAVVLVGLLAVGAYAFAQSDRDGSPLGGHSPWEQGWGGWHHRGPDPERVQQLRADLAADLAAELDTSAEAVEAAFRGVVAQRLQEAVEAGDIEQDRADEALAAYDDGRVGPLFHLFKR